MRTYSFLKDISTKTKRLCNLKGSMYFTYVHEDEFVFVCADFYDLATTGK